MDEEFLEEITKKLQLQKVAIENRIEEVTLEIAENNEVGGDTVDDVNKIMEINNMCDAIKAGKNRLSEIESALRRIKEGTYGYCEETGEAIDIERLQAIPTAKFCLDSQEKQERNKAMYLNRL